MTTFYKKVGRRYVPVLEHDDELLSSLEEGHHLISAIPGLRSTTHRVDPNHAPVLAVMKVAKEKMLEAMLEASKLRPQAKLLTSEQREAYQRLMDVLGDDKFYLQYDSMNDIIEAGIKTVVEDAAKLMDNETVKESWEHYAVIAELTKKNEYT